MNRREAIAKATITTTDAAAGLLDPTQSAAFIRKLKNDTSLSGAMRQEIRTASAGEINKIATGARIIRAATENADDGYRAGATFDVVQFTTKKVRLPWEVTEDVFHENIEGAGLESTLTSEMTDQFALDLEDLEINGDTAAGAGPDQAFLQINDGILKLITTAAVAGRNINGATINSGTFGYQHMFAALKAMPNPYKRNMGAMRWMMSPARKQQWWESIVNRDPANGQDLLLGNSPVLDRPLGIPIMDIASWPDATVVLADPKQFVRVISWQVRKRKVTGDTDAELAAKDKRFYIFFIKHDVIVEETDAVIRVYGLTAP